MNIKLLFLSFLFLLSCSVQKRKYQRGFYVNWVQHKKIEKQVGEPNTKQKEKNGLVDHIVLPNKVDRGQGRVSVEIETMKEKEVWSSAIHAKFVDILRSEKMFGFEFKGISEKSQSANPAKSHPPKYGKVHPYAQTAFALNMLSIATVVAYFVLLSSTAFIMSTFILFMVTLMIFAIVSNIFGGSAKKRIKKRPDLYRGKHLAVSSIILGWVIFGLLLGLAAFVYLWVLAWSGLYI